MSETTETAKPSAQVFRLVDMRKDEVVPTGLADTTPTIGAADEIVANAFDKEDEFKELYLGGARDSGILEPPYKLRLLDRLCHENNALSTCIEAMVTNIAGTGFDFERAGERVETETDDQQIDELRELFGEPWPGKSHKQMLEDFWRDVERVGNGYIEVVRNNAGEIVFWRHVDAKMMRLCKLDKSVPVTRKVTRKGVDVTVKLRERTRRYVQIVNGVSVVYFKEFGSKRKLDKRNGNWETRDNPVKPQHLASEIIHLRMLPDAHTPYGVPRWISQLPSVLGSRKAEEFNLEFFDNGGIPPMLIILQGGMLQHETRKALEQSMSGPAGKKQRASILEVEPTGGSMDNPTQARVTVERFGAERQNDSMFENYDDKCESRIRRAFRLPPMFVGAGGDYSYASAYTSYTIAEAQVFKPEREKLDQIMNMGLLPELGYTDYRYRSKPMTISEATIKLQGIELAMGTNRVDPADVIYEINEAVGTHMRVTDEPVDPMGPGGAGKIPGMNQAGTPVDPPAPSNINKDSVVAD